MTSNWGVQTLNPGYLRWATHPEYPQQIAVPGTDGRFSRKAWLSFNLIASSPGSITRFSRRYPQPNCATTWRPPKHFGPSTISRVKNNCRPVLADTPGKPFLTETQKSTPFYERRQQPDLPESTQSVAGITCEHCRRFTCDLLILLQTMTLNLIVVAAVGAGLTVLETRQLIAR